MEPENWVGNGAFVPEIWEPNTQIRLVANESYWDYENVGVQTVELALGLDETAALSSFTSGEVDVARASPVTITQRDDLEENMVTVDGYTSVYLERMKGGHEASQDVRVRRALSMALDREALAAVGGAEGAGITMIPGNAVPGWDESIAIEADVDGARALMEEAGLDSSNMPNLRVMYTTDDPFLSVLADQWQEAFNTNVQIDVQEWGVYAETREEPYEDESTISYYGGTFGGIPTLNNWINNIFGPDYVMRNSLSVQDWPEYQELEADEDMEGAEKAAALEEFLREHADPDAVRFADLAGEARSIIDGYDRVAAFLEAAQLREEMAYTIPIAWRPMTLVVADHVSGFVPRPSPEVAYFKYISVAD